jgi:hypothetical protein
MKEALHFFVSRYGYLIILMVSFHPVPDGPVGTSHSAKQMVSTPLVLVQTILTTSETVDSTYIYSTCDWVRASQPALISEASTLIGWPLSRGHCINMRLQARRKFYE